MEWIANAKTAPEKFINEFMSHCSSVDDMELLRSTFRSGYCYYFAHMLKMAFGRGTVCWTAPYGHFVWVDEGADKYETDYDKIRTYDIEGKYNPKEHNTYYLIPESYIKDFIGDFLHNGNEYVHATKSDLIKAVKIYCDENEEIYYDDIENYFCNEL